MSIENTIKEIEALPTVTRTGTIKTCSQGDIDFFLSKEYLADLLLLLKERGALIQHRESEEYIFAYIIHENTWYHMDFKYGSKKIIRKHGDITLIDKFFVDSQKNPDLERFFRYSLELRSGLKYKKFVNDHFDIYGSLFLGNDYFSSALFQKNITKNQLLAAMSHKPLALLRVFGTKNILHLFYVSFISRLMLVNSGKIVAFVGADGSGKTTAIENAALFFGSPFVHMGDGSQWFRKKIDSLYKQPIFIARLTYTIIYLEHHWRLLKMLYWKLSGKVVLSDRWPATNRHLRKDGWQMYLNRAMYALFPDPDLFIFLHAPADTIYARKKDLLPEEIESIQLNLEAKLQGKKYIKIETLDIEKSNWQAVREILSLFKD